MGADLGHPKRLLAPFAPYRRDWLRSHCTRIVAGQTFHRLSGSTCPMNVLYPAKSEETLSAICEKLAAVFALPPFCTIRRSLYLQTAQSALGPLEIT